MRGFDTVLEVTGLRSLSHSPSTPPRPLRSPVSFAFWLQLQKMSSEKNAFCMTSE